MIKFSAKPFFALRLSSGVLKGTERLAWSAGADQNIKKKRDHIADYVDRLWDTYGGSLPETYVSCYKKYCTHLYIQKQQ